MICCSVKPPLAVPRRFAMLRLLAMRLVGMTGVGVAEAADTVWLAAVTAMVFPVLPFLSAAVGIIVIAEVGVVGEVTAAMGEPSLGLGEELDVATTVLVEVAAAGAELAIGVTVIKLRCVASRVAILFRFVEFGKLCLLLWLGFVSVI